MVTAKAKTKSKSVSKVGNPATAKKAKGKVASKSLPKSVKKAPPKPAPKTTKKAAAKPAAKPVTKVVPKVTANVRAKATAKAAPHKPAVVPVKPVVSALAKPSTVKVGGRLSEAEVIKQAKTEYMSRQQLAFFKQRLLDLQNELRENAGATTEHLRELSVAPDPADRATLEEEHALELRTRDRERKLLKKVQSALMRIEDGSYGYCEETGEPIGIERLMARPTATLTIEAQERREMKQKMYGE